MHRFFALKTYSITIMKAIQAVSCFVVYEILATVHQLLRICKLGTTSKVRK